MIKRLLGILLSVLLLAGCLPRALPNLNGSQASQPGSPRLLTGAIGKLPAAYYHVAAVSKEADFVNHATVSFIDVKTGASLGSCTTDTIGNFQVDLGSNFVPVRANPGDTRSIAYYLEALKGVTGRNSAPNQVGADAVRLRNIIWYDFTAQNWVSLANSTPGPLTLTFSTTAVAFYIGQALLNSLVVDPATYIGCLNLALYSSINPATATPVDYTVLAGANLSVAMYQGLWLAVYNAFQRDQDPIHSLVLDTSNPTAIPVSTQTEFSVIAKTPASGVIGQEVTIQGLNFAKATMQVSFTGEALATVDQASSSNTVLKVLVPPGARSGLIRVTLDGISTYTDNFTVNSDDGHRTLNFDTNGNLSFFAVSRHYGSLVKIDQDGTTTTLNTTLNSPRAVLVNPEATNSATFNVYVADAGTNRIVKMLNDGTVVDANWLTATDPQALAVGKDGDLYVAQTSQNSVLRADVNWTAGTVTNAALATYTNITAPMGLAFDYKGYCYTILTSSDLVRRFKPQLADTGTVALTYNEPAQAPYEYGDWASIPGPAGVAIDTAGKCYVSSQTNNVIFTIDAARNLSAFTSLDAPGSISRDAQGNLYISDTTRNLIRRITLAGDQRILAYGLTDLRGMTVDSNNNLYVSLYNAGAVMKISPDRKNTSTLIKGIAAPIGLNYRNNKIYIGHNDTGTQAKSGYNDNVGPYIEEVDPLTGADRSVITNPSLIFWPPAAEASDSNPNLYYVPRLFGVYGGWQDSQHWFNTFDTSGLNIVDAANSTVTVRRPLVGMYHPMGGSNWNTLAGAMEKIDDDRWLTSDIRYDHVILGTRLNGNNAHVAWKNVSPGGPTAAFPNDPYDMVYDGARYVYVSCRDGNIYRLDSTNWSAAPGLINGFGTGYPYGLTYGGGVLFATDPVNNKLYKISSPSTATTCGATFATFGSGLAGIAYIPATAANFASTVIVADHNNYKLVRVNPADMSFVDHATGLPGKPSRLRAYNNGNTISRTSDGIFYTTTGADAEVAAGWSTVGCGGCSTAEFTIVQSDNSVHHWHPWTGAIRSTALMQHAHSIIRDGAWLFMGTTNVLYGMNLNTNEDISLAVGNTYGVTVDTVSHTIYSGNTSSALYSIDPSTWAVTAGPSLDNVGSVAPGRIWGVAYSNTDARLYATANGNNSIFVCDPAAGGTWNKTLLKVGLHTPLF